MKKITLLFAGMFAWSAVSVHAQMTKDKVWAPTFAQTDTFIYGGNYKNTVQAGVKITVLDKGSADITKPTPAIGDYKFPHWDLLWHFNNLKDNKGTVDPLDDVATTYCKVSEIAYTDTLFWVAGIGDPNVPLNKTVAASHLPTRNGIFFAGVDANEGKHALSVYSMLNIADSKYEFKDWCRLQSYTGGGNAVLVESVPDFLSLLNWGKVIKERARSGDGSEANPYKYYLRFIGENISVPDSSAVFGIKVAEGDNALAFYPGKYNKTDLRMAFQFDSSRVSSDITFKLSQVSKGTSGKNMNYKMIVSLRPPTSTNNFTNIGSKIFLSGSRGTDNTDSTTLGENGPNRYVINNVFEAQGGANEMTAATTISLVDKIKTINPQFTIDSLSKKRIIVAIIGESTEPAAVGTHHPIIAIDDIHVSYWIDWYKTINGGLYTGIGKTTVASTKVIGLKGQIQITGAQASGAVYNLTGRKVATFTKGNRMVTVPAGIYLVKENNKPTVKVLVK